MVTDLYFTHVNLSYCESQTYQNGEVSQLLKDIQQGQKRLESVCSSIADQQKMFNVSSEGVEDTHLTADKEEFHDQGI